MVCTEFNIDIPDKYRIVSYYLDPTKRKPLKGRSLEQANTRLSAIASDLEKESDNLNQVQLYSEIVKHVTETLDIYSPLNPSDKMEKKIYRFIQKPETTRLVSQKRAAYRQYLSAKIKNQACVSERWTQYKKKRNKANIAARKDRDRYSVGLLEVNLKDSKSVWDYIRSFEGVKDFNTNEITLSINGREGAELAERFADYFYKRSNLVDAENAQCFEEHMTLKPFREGTPYDISKILPMDPQILTTVKTKPSYTCGPDTISLKHLNALLPSLQGILKTCFNKEFSEFPDISKCYTRLIPKERIIPGQKLTLKSQRPIAELDILPKYTFVKSFMEEFSQMVIPHLNNNQYALPGKGCPIILAETLDEISFGIAQKKPVIAAFYDFSNAFCTTFHEATMKIVRQYNFTDRTLDLLQQFIEQSDTHVKFSDQNGFHISTMRHHDNGELQGQIGSDIVFTVTNDDIQPDNVYNVVTKRFKYVDDTTDINISETVREMFLSLKHNLKKLINQASAVGLKLNDDKTGLMPFNIAKADYDPDFKEEQYITEKTLFGVKFANVNNKLSCEDQATSVIRSLGGSTNIIAAMRKFKNTSLASRIKCAEGLVWKSLWCIDTIYPFISQATKDDIDVAVRRLLKAAGLNNTMSSNLLIKLTIKIPVYMIAKKRNIVVGLKRSDLDVIKNDRYIVKKSARVLSMPLMNDFAYSFNKIAYKSRKFIVDTFDPLNSTAMDKIKEVLHKHFVAKFDEVSLLGPLKKTKEVILNENRYFIRKRPRENEDDISPSEEPSESETECSFSSDDEEPPLPIITTPKGQRSRIRSISNMRIINKCLAPKSTVQQPEKEEQISYHSDPLRTPKRKRIRFEDNNHLHDRRGIG